MHSSTVPIGYQAPLVQHGAQLAAHDPTMIGLSLPADLIGAPTFPYGMTQFDAVAVGHAQDGGLGQEAAGPVLLGLQLAEETGAFRQFGEEVAIVVPEPVVEGPLADVLDGLQHANGDQSTEGEDGLAVVGNIGQGVVYLTEQFGDKIGDVHRVHRC